MTEISIPLRLFEIRDSRFGILDSGFGIRNAALHGLGQSLAIDLKIFA